MKVGDLPTTATSSRENSAINPFTMLPVEIVLTIFSKLGINDLAKLALVSKRFKRISEDHILWKSICYRHSFFIPSKTSNYKNFFRVAHKLMTEFKHLYPELTNKSSGTPSSQLLKMTAYVNIVFGPSSMVKKLLNTYRQVTCSRPSLRERFRLRPFFHKYNKENFSKVIKSKQSENAGVIIIIADLTSDIKKNMTRIQENLKQIDNRFAHRKTPVTKAVVGICKEPDNYYFTASELAKFAKKNKVQSAMLDSDVFNPKQLKTFVLQLIYIFMQNAFQQAPHGKQETPKPKNKCYLVM